MPRKVDPHRNEQTHIGPTDFVERVELPGDVEKLLPEGLSLEQNNLALENIRYAFGEYRWEQEAGPHRYSRGEAAKALRDLLAAGDFRRPALSALNQRAYDLLYGLTPGREPKLWMLGFDESDPPEHALREGADRALNMLNTQKGPEKSVALNVLATRLCQQLSLERDLCRNQINLLFHQTGVGAFLTRPHGPGNIDAEPDEAGNQQKEWPHLKHHRPQLFQRPHRLDPRYRRPRRCSHSWRC